MLIRKIFFIVICLFMIFALASCSYEKPVKPDSPMNTAWLMKSAIDQNDYDRFNKLFSEGRKGSVSKETLNEFNEIATTGSSYDLYELVTFTNGEMLLVRFTPCKIDGEYKIEDVIKVPDEMKEFFSRIIN